MPNEQNEQNLKNELYEQLERRQEREEREDMEQEQVEHEQEQHAEPANPNAMQQGGAPGQVQWTDNMEVFRERQAQETQMRSEQMRRELAAKARADQKEEDARKQKRRQRDQQYNRQIERGGPGAIWAAMRKAFAQLVGDVVSDVARGLWTGVKMGTGLAKDAVIDHYRTRGAEPRSEAAEGHAAEQPEPIVEQAQPQTEKAAEVQQPTVEQVQPEAEKTAVQPEQTVQQVQPQAMPHSARQERSFAERRDSIGRELNGLDTMCRAATLITGEQPSRRDMAVALACMHDPSVSGMSAGQSRFESEKLMRYLSGEQLSLQDGPLNHDLLKKGLNAARQPGALERKGFLGALHDLSRVITRAPSLDAPHRMAAGEALDEIAKECTKAAKPELRIVGMRNTAISGNINANEAIRKVSEIRSAMTCSDIYRRGRQAQYDELDRICQMQERGMNIQNRIMSPENAKAIAESEALNRNLAEQMVRERIALNQQQDISRRVNDIARMPMPNPMTMEVSGFVRNLGRDPRHMETVWQNGLRNLESVKGLQTHSAVSILEDMEKNQGGLAERMREDSVKLRSEKTYRKEQEKRREQEKQHENSRGPQL